MAALDTASKIAAYMRRKIDDPGLVGYPYSAQADDLAIAYEEFRQYCPPECFEVPFNPPALAGAFQVDLSGSIYGPPPIAWVGLTVYTLGQTRVNAGNVYLVTVAGTSAAAPGPTGTATAILDGTVTWRFTPQSTRLTRVIQVDTTGALLTVFVPAASFETLGQSPASGPGQLSNIYGGTRWWLDGRILRFSRPISGNVQIWYVPLNEIDWTRAITPGAVVWVSDLIQFHDIIALLAAQAYMIKEGDVSKPLQLALQRRLDALEEYFAKSRSGEASRWISDARW